MTPIRELLTSTPVEASAPCRLDSGGTWDIKALALPFEAIGPTTVNIALDLRTRAVLHPFEEGWVKIDSAGFAKSETAPVDRLPLDSAFGLFFAAVSWFGFHGMEVRLESRSPVRSGLGGSSTALIAVIKALSKVRAMLGAGEMARKEILHLGYQLEDGVSGGNCGMQDQAAAVYGGVNQWEWCYGNPGGSFKRKALLDSRGQGEFSRRLIVAYSGKRHTSLETNLLWIGEFLSGKTRARWIEANEIVRRFGEAIRGRQWDRAAALLREEMSIRREITPGALTAFTGRLIREAEETGCGARFTGAGNGGSVWAIGALEKVERLRERWGAATAPVEGAAILDCRVDAAGVR